MKKYQFFLISILLMAGPRFAVAQDAPDEAESFFNKQEDEISKEPSIQAKKPETTPATTNVKEISDLGKLAPFKDIAVIQKRFLPKTGRFELFGALGGTLNDAFFIDATANLRLGYYFRERYGIEFTGLYISTSNRTVTDSLAKRGVTTASLVTPQSYYGLDFKYTPIYGKMAFGNKTLTPFDMYFSGGLGQTSYNNGSAPTLHLGTGQIFAMSKAFALRWDFSWNFFQATTYINSTQTVGSSAIFNNLFVLLGASWFFPEATYR
jgi:outer membrane beta-barrel protein